MTQPLLPGDMLAGWALRTPRKTALVEDDRCATWMELDDAVSRLAGGMAAHGVRPGDAVGMLAPDRSEVVVHLLACLRMGAVRVGINPRYSAREVLHVIRDCDARMVLVDRSLVGLLGEAPEALRGEGRVIVVVGDDAGLSCDDGSDGPGPDGPGGFGKGWLRYGDLLSSPRYEPGAVSEDALALISYTSGSTGMPKGVLVTQGAVAAAIGNTVTMIGLAPDDVMFQATSMAWIAGLFALLGLANGMTVVLPGGSGKFDTAHFLEAVGRHGVTATVLAPVMIRRVLDELDQSSYDMSSFRILAYGSSPAQPALLRRVHTALPAIRLVQLYGLSECSGGWVTALTHADHLRGLANEPGLLASCGRPGPLVEVRVVNEAGSTVDMGERGEVWLRSPMNCVGYHRLPEQTERLMAGEWIRTHDIGWMDDEGFLYLTDRKDFMIITGGMNVYPSVVENVLAEHPAVRDVAVVGVEHPEWEEAVVAMIEPRGGEHPDPGELVAFCRERLGAFEVPKYVKVVEELPRGVTGKILKPALIAELKRHPEQLPWNAGEILRDVARVH